MRPQLLLVIMFVSFIVHLPLSTTYAIAADRSEDAASKLDGTAQIVSDAVSLGELRSSDKIVYVVQIKKPIEFDRKFVEESSFGRTQLFLQNGEIVDSKKIDSAPGSKAIVFTLHDGWLSGRLFNPVRAVNRGVIKGTLILTDSTALDVGYTTTDWDSSTKQVTGYFRSDAAVIHAMYGIPGFSFGFDKKETQGPVLAIGHIEFHGGHEGRVVYGKMSTVGEFLDAFGKNNARVLKVELSDSVPYYPIGLAAYYAVNRAINKLESQ